MGVNDQPRFHALSAMGNQHALVLPPSSRVAAYVRAGAAAGEYPQEIAKDLVSTLAAGLAKCRSGYGDVVVVLRGHAENVTDTTMLDNLQPGTHIIGEGPALPGANMPKFTWTVATGCTWTLDQAGVVIRGLYLDWAGVDANDEPMTATAPTLIEGNVIRFSTGTNEVAEALGFETGSDGSIVRGNEFRGESSTAATSHVIALANAITDVQIVGNLFHGSVPAAAGFIGVDAAATRLYIADNDMYNTTASSTAGISVADAASDGIIARNMIAVLNDATPASGQGIVFSGTTSTLKCFENYSADEPRKSGMLTPAVVT